MKLFHYTTLENLLKILDSNTFILSSFNKANDYKERIEKFPFLYHKNIDEYRFLSTSFEEIDSLGHMNGMLWYFYGDKHRGVCIELQLEQLKKLNPLKEDKIKYKDGVTHIDNQNELEYLMEKRNCWQGESEYRFLFDDRKEIPNFSKYINAIYLGANVKYIKCVNEELKQLLKNNDKENCIIYEMSFDKKDGRMNKLDARVSTMVRPITEEMYDFRNLN